MLIVFLRVLRGRGRVIDYHLTRLILQLDLSATIMMHTLVVITAYVSHRRLTLVYDYIVHIWSWHHLRCAACVVVRAFADQVRVETRRATCQVHSGLWIKAVVWAHILQPLL